MNQTFSKLLIANRGEIAIRVLRAANELGIKTVAIYSEEDKLALHRFKADESYLVGKGLGPISAYLAIPSILNIARQTGVDAIHPGYGFLAENAQFADQVEKANMTFIGPGPKLMRQLGDKVSARNLAQNAKVPTLPAATLDLNDLNAIKAKADAIGYPLILKAAFGGGGRGMRLIETDTALESALDAGQREAAAAFGDGTVFLEKFLPDAHHIEVQILGDRHGQVVHLFERDCSIQRRYQKIIERAPAPFITAKTREELCESALKIARACAYVGAGTVEFLLDKQSGKHYFIEVNPRIQVEHTVTEEVTGVDLVKAQIRIAAGAKIGDEENCGVPRQSQIKLNGHALQCRITSEDPEANFVPDYGRISAYRGANGFGIRLDGGTAYAGAVITRHYDSLLEKVTAWAPEPNEAIRRMDRALREFRIRGIATNLAFLENLINREEFRNGSYSTRFVDKTPELFAFAPRKDRATRLLNFIAETSVNGNREVDGRPQPEKFLEADIPDVTPGRAIPKGQRDRLLALGADAFAKALFAQKQPLVTDTTMRDGHQSLIATRMRTRDLVRIAPFYAQNLAELFSVECWGGATFDVAMRFLNECPWERLARLRQAMPGHLLQMLLRGANAVGYASYPPRVVRAFVAASASEGIDLFRVFDALNAIERMDVAIDEVRARGAICEGTICYTGDLLNPNERKYDLDYYLDLAHKLKAMGCHMIGIKDMAGIMKPNAARTLIPAIREETQLPVHFHTHDTSGISAATVMAAVEAGVDVFDAALDAFSGLTSQPNLGSLVEALRGTEYDTGMNPEAIRKASHYFENTRANYRAFETPDRASTSDVFSHAMPGGQMTNLREQARALGLENRWEDIARTYAEVNLMFGDIVKVTPSSKIVGDMALAMLTGGLSAEDVLSPEREIAFPDSVIAFFRGDIGVPYQGFPEALRNKVLAGQTEASPLSDPPDDLDLQACKKDLEAKVDGPVSDRDLLSYLMYPKVFETFYAFRKAYGDVSSLPTPVFYYGMREGEMIYVDIDPGKTLVIHLQAQGASREKGHRKVFFELNGQPRSVRVQELSQAGNVVERRRAEHNNSAHLGAPMPGVIATIGVQVGQKVHRGDFLMTIEAMKMESAVQAPRDGTIKEVCAAKGDQVEAHDLLLTFTEA